MENSRSAQGMGDDKSAQHSGSSMPYVPPSNLSTERNAYVPKVATVQNSACSGNIVKHPATATPSKQQVQRQLQNWQTKLSLLENQIKNQSPEKFSAGERESTINSKHNLHTDTPIASFGQPYRPGLMLPAQQNKNHNGKQQSRSALQTDRVRTLDDTRALNETPPLDIPLEPAAGININIPTTSQPAPSPTSTGDDRPETIRSNQKYILELFESFLGRYSVTPEEVCLLVLCICQSNPEVVSKRDPRIYREA